MANEPIKFQPSLVKEAEQDFGKLHTSETQDRIVIEIAKILNMYLGLSVDLLTGMVNKTLIDWQEENYKPIEYFETSTPEERIPVVDKILEALKNKYLSSMIDESVSQMALDSAIDNAFIFYQDRHAYR
ncbi:MAG: hypothetical protein ACXAD7_18925 [Candidatus Kariarchaeaceae archaeon]|jgi:hypothetical protein